MEINKTYNENCFNTFSRMPDNFVDVVFTSPPYNRKRNDKYKFFDDREVNYYDFLINAIDESIRVSKGLVFFNIMKNYYNKKDIFRLFGHYYDKICEVFTWCKTNPLPASGKAITNGYEFIFVFGDQITSNYTYTKNYIITSKANMPKNLKAVMKQEIAEFFIKNFTQEGDLIYDPFMGYGTTAKVAKELGRNYIGSEITKEYYDEYLIDI